MKCVVINGTEQKGCTYNLKEIFLDELKPKQLTEFYLSKDDQSNLQNFICPKMPPNTVRDVK